MKKHFDCIIIDSSPIGIVSDTYYLASLADLCLVIVRYEKTLKIALEKTVNELKLSGIKSVSLIINDLPLDSRNYGYGGKYGYTKSTEPGSNTTKLLKKKILQRSKLGKNRQKVVSTETPWHSKI